MSDKEPLRQEEETPEPYTPASPVKRAMAWVGVVYMVLLVGLTTYFYFTGRGLFNLAPLLAVPGLTGLGVISILSWRTAGRPEKVPAILLAVLCWGAALYSLPLGIAGLLSNFSG